MKLRFIVRNGENVLQYHTGRFGSWKDVPTVSDKSSDSYTSDHNIEELKKPEVDAVSWLLCDKI